MVEREKQRFEQGVIAIGGKPFEKYLNAIQVVMNDGSDKVVIKAMGKQTCRAIDLAMHRQFENMIECKEVNLGYVNSKNDSGRDIRVSSIEIIMVRKK